MDYDDKVLDELGIGGMDSVPEAPMGSKESAVSSPTAAQSARKYNDNIITNARREVMELLLFCVDAMVVCSTSDRNGRRGSSPIRFSGGRGPGDVRVGSKIAQPEAKLDRFWPTGKKKDAYSVRAEYILPSRFAVIV